MDRSLWLLLFLRLRGWLRRRVREILTARGMLLAAVGSIIFLPMLGTAFVGPRVLIGAQLDVIRHYGPLALLTYCVMNVFVSAGDRSLYFAPAEIHFLFSGPYRPRQLVLYKVVGGAGGALICGLLMACVLGHHTAMFASAFVGTTLMLELVYLFSLCVGLTASTSGALAYSRGRKLVLASFLMIVFGSLWPLGRGALGLPIREVVARATDAPAVAVMVAPFRPFVRAFTAERVWPDLVLGGASAALVDLALLLAVLALNARFMEAAAVSSARAYERILRVRRGDLWGGAGGGSFRFPIPSVPWWFGIGPNLWRQLTAASRSPRPFAGLSVMLAAPVALAVFRLVPAGEREVLTVTALICFAIVALVGQTILGFDFRADHTRMEALKTLPIPPSTVVLGQILVPVVLLSLMEWVGLAVIGWGNPASARWAAALAVMVGPANLLLGGVDNLYFLLFPYVTVGVSSLDVQAFGRQLLLMAAKGAAISVSGGVACGLGAAVYWFGGENLAAAVGTAACVVTGFGFALVPLVAWAFERFDVSPGAAE